MPNQNNMKHSKILLIFTIFSLVACGQKVQKLKPVNWVSIDIPEPSDICYNPKTDTYFIVSDNGILFECDNDLKIIKQNNQQNTDFEAVYANESNVFCVDESGRNIYGYKISDFSNTQVISKPFAGARNKGYESLTYNNDRNIFIIITERDPAILFELDKDFKTINQVDISDIAKDISSATYHEGFLWLLSDEDMQIIKLDPISYKVISQWKIPVLSPEGITFDKNNNIVITSDDLQRVYYFNNPEKQ